MTQEPAAGARLLRWVGDILEVKVARSEKRRTAGRMVFRTNLGSAAIRQAEVLAHVDESRLISGDDWHDIPMEPCGRRQWRVRIPLLEVGVFEGKACFLPDGDPIPEWPEGPNTVIKVAPARTAAGNMIYAAFTRQFGRNMAASEAPRTHAREEALLDRAGYTVIPPSGTFRSLIRHLELAPMQEMLQLLSFHVHMERSLLAMDQIQKNVLDTGFVSAYLLEGNLGHDTALHTDCRRQALAIEVIK